MGWFTKLRHVLGDIVSGRAETHAKTSEYPKLTEDDLRELAGSDKPVREYDYSLFGDPDIDRYGHGPYPEHWTDADKALWDSQPATHRGLYMDE